MTKHLIVGEMCTLVENDILYDVWRPTQFNGKFGRGRVTE